MKSDIGVELSLLPFAPPLTSLDAIFEPEFVWAKLTCWFDGWNW